MEDLRRHGWCGHPLSFFSFYLTFTPNQEMPRSFLSMFNKVDETVAFLLPLFLAFHFCRACKDLVPYKYEVIVTWILETFIYLSMKLDDWHADLWFGCLMNQSLGQWVMHSCFSCPASLTECFCFAVFTIHKTYL